MKTAQVEEVLKTLDASMVQVLESVAPQAATATYALTVSLFEKYGRAFISWQLDPNWAIGPDDCVQLREGSAGNNWKVTTTSGEVDTGHVWGSSLNASYWSKCYYGSSAGWRQLVVTPNT